MFPHHKKKKKTAAVHPHTFYQIISSPRTDTMNWYSVQLDMSICLSHACLQTCYGQAVLSQPWERKRVNLIPGERRYKASELTLKQHNCLELLPLQPPYKGRSAKNCAPTQRSVTASISNAEPIAIFFFLTDADFEVLWLDFVIQILI